MDDNDGLNDPDFFLREENHLKDDNYDYNKKKVSMLLKKNSITEKCNDENDVEKYSDKNNQIEDNIINETNLEIIQDIQNYENDDNKSSNTKNKLIHKDIPLKIHNIISSANLDTEIDLRLVAVSIKSAEYNPSKINTLIIRINHPKCTALIFKSGRIMLTGTKSKTDSINGCKKIGKIIKFVTNQNIRLKNFKIENIIASANCNIPVRLEMLAHDHKDYCNYEPELFAGLVYRYKPTSNLKSVILIFVSGKIIITGCKSLQKLNTVFQDIYNVLVQYKS
ncbi:TATA-box binding protein, putative [Plasmodium chabaudi chabaudi]|uniref:TATA-box-binding protein, putative n=2 Tax=Plasmodium chabaudi TaxID=5825 RepID=A0A077TML4_PLACU|nr:TATA-box-binding protein, putative [Plasmodium chabaudi chabaudi]SCM23336.1 TATA-box binding protein, putative [Plasmodium chabaudi chabaudi]SCN60851.1 TATA-box binding protein, putative [Plasmodium chabaudi adami]SCN60873.1 TATA-box binding protein, putative [Plasmodium chabaudi chabaudi]VTZ69051.1 TATA-box-binding protein, putative [Plasmodium chabaudi chabaudi]|eukprot:XP_740763.2 TATA-box binding protein, putative [Plasmodium chabaudi chabaudi]